jgi:ketosteroid isomerase-like protein
MTLKTFNHWLDAWDNHDIEGIMELLHDEIIFENWDGTIIKGKKILKKAWVIWFSQNDNFKFTKKEIFIDDHSQKLLFRWQLKWKSHEKNFENKYEVRDGVDIIHYNQNKIILKTSFIKTKIRIENKTYMLNPNHK